MTGANGLAFNREDAAYRTRRRAAILGRCNRRAPNAQVHRCGPGVAILDEAQSK